VWERGDAYTGFWWGNLKERDHLEDRGVDGGDNIKMDHQKVGCGDMDWTEMALNRVRWRAFVNAIMNFRVP